jgi:hypothetical protein
VGTAGAVHRGAQDSVSAAALRSSDWMAICVRNITVMHLYVSSECRASGFRLNLRVHVPGCNGPVNQA